MKWTTIGLVVVLSAQAVLTYVALTASSTMEDEWLKVVKLRKTVVIDTLIEDFWGPVKMIIPLECDEVDADEEDFGGNSHDEPGFREDGKLVVKTHGHWSALNSTATLGRQAEATGPNEMNFRQEPHGQKLQAISPPARGLLQADASEAKQRRLQQPSESAHDAHEEAKLKNKLKARYYSTKEHLKAKAKELVMKAKKNAAEGMTKLMTMAIKQPVVRVRICNYTVDFKTPRFWKRYLSMMSLSWEKVSTDMNGVELHEERVLMHHRFKIGLLVLMVAKYSLKLMDIISDFCGHSCWRRWNNERSRFDRALESLMIHGPSMIFCLAQQILLCSMFLSFWRTDHFVMVYVPRIGYRVFFWSFVMMTLYVVSDRLCGCMEKGSYWYIFIFWCSYLAWMFFICAPMVGSCIFAANYVWMIAADGWLGYGMSEFSDEFKTAALRAVSSCSGFLVVAVLDIVVIVACDLERRSHATKVGPTSAWPSRSTSRKKVLPMEE